MSTDAFLVQIDCAKFALGKVTQLPIHSDEYGKVFGYLLDLLPEHGREGKRRRKQSHIPVLDHHLSIEM